MMNPRIVARIFLEIMLLLFVIIAVKQCGKDSVKPTTVYKEDSTLVRKYDSLQSENAKLKSNVASLKKFSDSLLKNRNARVKVLRETGGGWKHDTLYDKDCELALSMCTAENTELWYTVDQDDRIIASKDSVISDQDRIILNDSVSLVVKDSMYRKASAEVVESQSVIQKLRKRVKIFGAIASGGIIYAIIRR